MLRFRQFSVPDKRKISLCFRSCFSLTYYYLLNLHENMFFCSCPRKFKCNNFDFCFTARRYINYLDIRKSVFLITKNFIHQKSEKVSTGEYVFLLLIQKMMKCSEKCAISKACPFSSPISVFCLICPHS